MFLIWIGGAGTPLSRSMQGEFTGSFLRLVKGVVVATSLVSLVASRAKRYIDIDFGFFVILTWRN